MHRPADFNPAGARLSCCILCEREIRIQPERDLAKRIYSHISPGHGYNWENVEDADNQVIDFESSSSLHRVDALDSWHLSKDAS